MKTVISGVFVLAALAVMLLISPPPSLTASTAAPVIGGDIHVGLIEGDILINTEDTQDWVPAASNMPLGESDRLWVSDGGRSELRLRRGTVMRLNSRTALEVVAIETGGLQFYVDTGEVYVHVEELDEDGLVIETPAATILPDQRSTFRIDVDENGDASVSVLTGAIKVERPYGDLKLPAGEGLIFKKDWDEPQPTSRRPPDEWEAWNRSRDHEQFAAGSSVSRDYLPQELIPYASDFDNNGRWVQTPEYGFVWTPTVVVMSKWAPYRTGRWVWMRGNYVWISQEPWGWAPHHYGRWAFTKPFGWCWVPPKRKHPHWGPGYVGWVQTSNAVSWIPLAPRDLYHGRGYYGPHSMNAARVQRLARPVGNVRPYTNVRVANAVTTIHRDTFLSGRPISLKNQPNPFFEKRTVFAPPAIKPVKETRMPALKEVRPSERPPAHLFAIKPHKIETIRKSPPASAPTKNIRTPVDVRPQSDRPNDRQYPWKNDSKESRVTAPGGSSVPQPTKQHISGPPPKMERPQGTGTKLPVQPGAVGVPAVIPGQNAPKSGSSSPVPPSGKPVWPSSGAKREESRAPKEKADLKQSASPPPSPVATIEKKAPPLPEKLRKKQPETAQPAVQQPAATTVKPAPGPNPSSSSAGPSIKGRNTNSVEQKAGQFPANANQGEAKPQGPKPATISNHPPVPGPNSPQRLSNKPSGAAGPGGKIDADRRGKEGGGEAKGRKDHDKKDGKPEWGGQGKESRQEAR